MRSAISKFNKRRKDQKKTIVLSIIIGFCLLTILLFVFKLSLLFSIIIGTLFPIIVSADILLDVLGISNETRNRQEIDDENEEITKEFIEDLKPYFNKITRLKDDK